MRRYFITIFFLLSQLLYAQDYPEWSALKISEDLKDHADVVVRKYDLKYEVVNEHKATKSIEVVKTILNSNGHDEAFFGVFYDDFRKIKKFDALILDSKGNKIDKIKNSEIIDYNPSGNSIDDQRVKIVDLSRTTYPYTIVVEYVVEFNTNFYSPDFSPQDEDRVSVENASFTLSFPETNPVRFKGLNISEPSYNENVYVWKVSNLKGWPFCGVANCCGWPMPPCFSW